LLDGNRAYAAVLSGYTVALIAIQQLDTPQHVFESGVARGAAIAVGIIALAVVNDLLAAPDSHPQLASQLAALHRRVRDYAKAVIRDEATDPATASGTAARHHGAPRRNREPCHGVGERLDQERSSAQYGRGPGRGTSRRSRPRCSARDGRPSLPRPDGVGAGPEEQRALADFVDVMRYDIEPDAPDSLSALTWASAELLSRDEEVHEGLAALTSGTRPRRTWRTPLYRSHRTAAEAGIRSAI
jgi:hypothetical protein